MIIYLDKNKSLLKRSDTLFYLQILLYVYIIILSKGVGKVRRAKIICTIGPACDDVTILTKMAKAGMNVARFNMSHGTHQSHKSQIDKVKDVRDKLNIALPIMIDTKGPEIRIRQFKNGSVELKNKSTFILTTEIVEGDETKVSVTFKDLPKIVSAGTKILINDGLIELKVKSTTNNDIICEVVFGGVLSNNKSINLPDIKLNMPYLSEQDKKDILFAVNNDVEYLALSFVRSRKDVIVIKDYLKRLNANNIKLISKIENQQGIDNLEEIIDESDGIMVARGDLGVEVPFERIPQIQKHIISRCLDKGKMVITATQMLESMIEHSSPTRAEISDVANAIIDGSGSVMLSGETSVGKFPILVVEVMDKIVRECEQDLERNVNFNHFSNLEGNVTGSVAFGACALAQTSNAKAIIAVTKTGKTAIEISRFRPSVNILGCTFCDKVYQQLGAVWGVIPIKQPQLNSTEILLEHAREMAKNYKLVKKGDLVVQTAGKETGIEGSNMVALNYV